MCENNNNSLSETREIIHESAKTDENQDSVSETESSNSKILLVDDNPDILQYLDSILKTNYTVLTAKNGKEGLDAAFEVIPDLIISDIMMPVMDGYEMCKLIKNDERTSHIPIIMLTARTSEEKQLEGLETGANDYITKPFNSEILVRKIGNLLDIRDKMREKFWATGNPIESIISRNSNAAEQQFLEKLFQIIDNNIDNENFDVDNIVKEMTMSRAQLFRKIKAITDQTVAEFVYSYRLHKSADMLLYSGKSVSEVCYSVGFKNPSHFTTRFKKQFGVSPSDYVLKHKKG